MQNYKYIPATQGKTTTFKINISKVLIPIIGYKAKEFEKIRQSAKEENKKITVVGFINPSKQNPMSKFRVTFKYNDNIFPIAVNRTHSNKIIFYFSVGNNRYIGLEKNTFKETFELLKNRNAQK